jgi:hypothetical protein
MGWDSDLGTTRDRVRALVGDTDAANEYFDDDHYDAVAALQSSFELYVAFIADELGVKLALEPNQVTLDDGTAAQWNERVGALKALAARMRALDALNTASSKAQSISVSVMPVW